jgi:hypothetical protein
MIAFSMYEVEKKGYLTSMDLNNLFNECKEGDSNEIYDEINFIVSHLVENLMFKKPPSSKNFLNFVYFKKLLPCSKIYEILESGLKSTKKLEW